LRKLTAEFEVSNKLVSLEPFDDNFTVLLNVVRIVEMGGWDDTTRLE